MKTWSALIIKFVLTLFFTFLAFYWVVGTIPWMPILGLALAATVINYLVGDLMILPAAGNAVAAAADGGIAALLAYGTSLVSPAFEVNWASLLLFAGLVIVGEYLLHLYLLRHREVAP